MLKCCVEIRPKFVKSPVIPGKVVALDVSCATSIKIFSYDTTFTRPNLGRRSTTASTRAVIAE